MSDIIHEVEIENLYKNQKELTKRIEFLEEVAKKVGDWAERQNNFNREILSSVKIIGNLISPLEEEKQ